MPATPPIQPSFDDLGTPLPNVTFCIVDLETTGGSDADEITEIGAVLARGGETIGEFHTLVRPISHIPAHIQVLTGITTAMVADAPHLSTVLRPFLEFASGAVLVAHNARFDIGFLQRACASHAVEWPRPRVIDTLALARQVLPRSEVPNYKLSTLAQHFRAVTQPNHRALSDARATVEVLHGLLERIGNLGANTLEDLNEFTHQVSPDRHAKRSWAADVPERPGVYWFQHGDEVLYVGKSVNLRRRVRSYFTAAEKRARIHEMVRIASSVHHIVCTTDLEAAVRELRLIDAHHPRYNRRSKHQHSLLWLKLTREIFPRLSVVRTVKNDADYWGPFPSKQVAEQASLAIYDAFRVRRCTTRLTTNKPSPSCALAELDRCMAPCERLDPDSYSRMIDNVRQTWQSDIRPLAWAVSARLHTLVAQQRFEEASEITQRVETCRRTSVRWHRIRSLARCTNVVAAAREGNGWAIHVVRFGRLAAAAHAGHGESPLMVAERAVRLAETVPVPAVADLPAASIKETELIAAWLETPGVRLIELDGDWSWPLHSGLTDDALARYLIGTGPAEEVASS